jgi:hypothetical protein
MSDSGFMVTFEPIFLLKLNQDCRLCLFYAIETTNTFLKKHVILS